jgi:hypothetical protein
MSRFDEPQAAFVHSGCTWCILSTDDRPWVTTFPNVANGLFVLRTWTQVVTSQCSSTCSPGGLADTAYTNTLRLSNQGVEVKRAARAFTKPKSPESWISVAVDWGEGPAYKRLSNSIPKRDTPTSMLAVSGELFVEIS